MFHCNKLIVKRPPMGADMLRKNISLEHGYAQKESSRSQSLRSSEHEVQRGIKVLLITNTSTYNNTTDYNNRKQLWEKII